MDLHAISDAPEERLVLTAHERATLTTHRAMCELMLSDLATLRDSLPEHERDTIGHGLLTAKGEIEGLLGISEDGA